MKNGDLSPVPYAEPLWLRPEFKSPYYNDSHRALQKAMRIFTDTYVTPVAQAREADGKYIDQELIDLMAKENIIAMRLGPGKHLHGLKLLGGIVKGEEFDYFHDLVLGQEMSRTNARGFQDGNLAGLVISLTAVQEWLNNEELKKHVNEECLSGRKKICLAISEAFAGSDVAGIRTTAGLSTHSLFMVSEESLLIHFHRENSRWKTLHNQRYKKMDHKRHVLGLYVPSPLPYSQLFLTHPRLRNRLPH